MAVFGGLNVLHFVHNRVHQVRQGCAQGQDRGEGTGGLAVLRAGLLKVHHMATHLPHPLSSILRPDLLHSDASVWRTEEKAIDRPEDEGNVAV